MDKLEPVITPETAEYWAAANRGELLIQHCGSCAARQFYPRPLCAACGSEQIEWQRASGQGVVASYSIARRPLTAAYADDVPYIVALIDLAEGPRMMSNVVACEIDAVQIGMAVEVTFERRSEELAVPVFRPA